MRVGTTMLHATRLAPPPAWALAQRQLIDTMNAAVPIFEARYTRPDGSFIWREEWPGMDGSDDGYESFGNWPQFYVLGGSADVYGRARRLWEAVTLQFTAYGQIWREFDAYYDWMHHGESSLCLYAFGLADPADALHRARALRFAHMYTGDDAQAPNWDAQLAHDALADHRQPRAAPGKPVGRLGDPSRDPGGLSGAV